MKTVDCGREQDVLDALTSGRWPDRADADLRGHVATCGICADVIDVAGALLYCRDDEPSDARIPSSAVMWWRAQMRARQEAAREAARPITVAQVIAAVAAIALTVAALVALSPQVGDVIGALLGGWVAGVRDAASSDTTVLETSSGLLSGGWMLPALMVAVWLVLAPVAIYFAVADD